MKGEKISIIIPVYNVEQYLHECLDSIINQTYQNLEIILVDDGSPDSCGLICDEYAQKDSRVKVIHKENGGLSSARNAGLEVATGEYFGFVDSDDYVSPAMFEKLYTALIENDADISICGLKCFGDFQYNISYPNSLLSSKQYLKALLNEKIKSFLWNKLYKRELLNKIDFPVGLVYEDVRIQHIIAEKTNKVALISDMLYHYRQHPKSITLSRDVEKKKQFVEAMHERSERYKNTEYYPYAIAGEVVALRGTVVQFIEQGEKPKELIKTSKKLIRLGFKYLSNRNKIISVVYYISPKLFCVMRKFIKH